jgi:serine/threonine-protein kinase
MSEHFEPGSVVSGYELEEVIGHGGFGTVWRARDPQTGTDVAVKIFSGAYAERDVARLRSEVEFLAASAGSASPHIVRVLDGGVSSVPYVVMEYVRGTDLQRELERRGIVSVEETLRIGRAVASALATLETKGIIHRDIKPSNILLADDGSIKLADFGIAKIAGYSTVTATAQMPLSMAYAAPEVWDGKATHLSDIYALGAMLYQLLAGKPPFVGTSVELYGKHLREQPDMRALPMECPTGLKYLIEQMLTKEPAGRPPNADAVLMRLADTASRPRRRSHALRRKLRTLVRRPAFLVAVGTSLLATTVIAGLLYASMVTGVISLRVSSEGQGDNKGQANSASASTTSTARWPQSEYERISRLAGGLSRAYFQDVLGTPMFSTKSADGLYFQDLFQGPGYWVQAVSDSVGAVQLMAVTSCAEDFRPTFSSPRMAPITLNVTRMTETNAAPMSVHYFTSGATANSHYFDEYYFGNPSEYKTYFVGANDACSAAIPDGPDGYTAFLFDAADGPFDPSDADVARFRAVVVANTYAETGAAVSFTDEAALRAFQIGPDRILTRTAPSIPVPTVLHDGRNNSPRTSIPSAAPSLPPYQIYTVSDGDSLSSIATRFGIGSEFLIANNPEVDRDFLILGQALIIPAGNGILHEVQEGETLSDIAKRYGVGEDAITSFLANGLDAHQGPVPTQLIFVPDATVPTTSR